MTIIAEAPRAGYSGAAKILHWLIVLLLIAQFIFGWTMPHIGRNTPVTTLISLHFIFGIVILAVAIVRLVVRLAQGEPEPAATLLAWERRVSSITYWLLYALLFVVPILGWLNASWRGMPIDILGLELPNLIATRASGWQWTGDVHGLLAEYGMLALVALHVGASLFHYFVRKDGVMQRMVPGLK